MPEGRQPGTALRTRMFSPARLRAARQQAAFTQTRTAHRAACTLRQYQRYEGGECLPTADVLAALADALGVSIDAFYAPRAQTPAP